MPLFTKIWRDQAAKLTRIFITFTFVKKTSMSHYPKNFWSNSTTYIKSATNSVNSNYQKILAREESWHHAVNQSKNYYSRRSTNLLMTFLKDLAKKNKFT